MTLPRRSLLAATVAALVPLAVALPVGAQTAVKVEGAWARPTVPGQGAGGGFLKITGGASADRLVAGRSPVSQAVELHAMSMDGDVMRMRQLSVIEVPAGRVVELKQGGLHLMFIGLKQPLKAGDSFPLSLRFEKAGEVTVDVKVALQPPAGATVAPAAGHKH